MGETIALPLSEAKAKFCTIIRDVREHGASYTILLRNVPVATISPASTLPDGRSKTRGLLSDYADAGLRSRESEAFAASMRQKHAHLA